jgi:hypothetical protein
MESSRNLNLEASCERNRISSFGGAFNADWLQIQRPPIVMRKAYIRRALRCGLCQGRCAFI